MMKIIKNKVRGFTLVELLIVMAILALLAVAMTEVLDPIALMNKGGDAKRKKDIRRIKIAMEEYMTDKGTLPTEATEPRLSELNNDNSCGGDIFEPWLTPWPCDPGGKSYKIAVDIEESPPAWFKVLTKLKNDNDSEIPTWWNDYPLGAYVVKGGYSNAEINFGVSSSNIIWYDRDFSGCSNDNLCYQRESADAGEGHCQTVAPNGFFCEGNNCFVDGDCADECRVSCCERGQPCN